MDTNDRTHKKHSTNHYILQKIVAPDIQMHGWSDKQWHQNKLSASQCCGNMERPKYSNSSVVCCMFHASTSLLLSFHSSLGPPCHRKLEPKRGHFQHILDLSPLSPPVQAPVPNPAEMRYHSHPQAKKDHSASKFCLSKKQIPTLY